MTRKRKKEKNSETLNKSSPKKKLLDLNKSVTSENGKIESCVDFSDICKQKWKVFRVSPMYNFTTNRLKKYGRKLSEELASKEKFSSNVTYETKFSLNSKLRISEQCHEALQVEVIANDSKSIYTGIFISESNKTQSELGYISLPILLVKAKGYDVYKIHSSLSKMFDCDICPVTFSVKILVIFFVKFLEFARNNINISEECLTLEYKIAGCTAKDIIKVTLSLEDTIIICALIVDNLQEAGEVISNLEIILEVYYRILNHIFCVYKMDLTLAELHKVVFPEAFVVSDGQLKMSSKDIALSVLQVLQNCISLEAQLKQYDSKVGIENL